MKIIVKKKSRKSTPKRTKKSYKPKRKSSSNKMAKRKSKKSRKRKSSSSRSSKDMLTKVPVLNKLVKNKTYMDVEKGAGRASVITRLAKLIPNNTVRQFADNPFVRAGLAYTGGGAPAGLYQFATDRGIIENISSQFGGNGQQSQQNGVGFA